jgi:EAL domain-containing protein (putative c-di-GMP-specific phosphodiesterase class I)
MQQNNSLVKELGVDEVQGYLLGRPTPNPSALLKKSAEGKTTAFEYASVPTLP